MTPRHEAIEQAARNFVAAWFGKGSDKWVDLIGDLRDALELPDDPPEKSNDLIPGDKLINQWPQTPTIQPDLTVADIEARLDEFEKDGAK